MRRIVVGFSVVALLVLSAWYNVSSHVKPVKAKPPADTVESWRVQEAKDIARNIQQADCKITNFEQGEYKEISLGVNCSAGFLVLPSALRVNSSHLKFLEYSMLHAAPVGTPVKFGFYEPGFNEANLSSPENDRNPAYYLVPKQAE